MSSYRNFVEATLKGLREGDELPDYFGCLSATVAQFLPNSFIHPESSLETAELSVQSRQNQRSPPRQSPVQNQPKSKQSSPKKQSPIRTSVNQKPALLSKPLLQQNHLPKPSKQVFVEEEEEEERNERQETSEIADSIHDQPNSSISPIKKTMQRNVSQSPVTQGKSPESKSFKDDDFEDDDDSDDESNLKKVLHKGRNFMKRFEQEDEYEEDEDEQIPKPFDFKPQNNVNISPQNPPPLNKKPIDSDSSSFLEEKPKSKYLLDTTNNSSFNDDGPFPKPLLDQPKQNLDIFPKPIPKVKPLQQDYAALFQKTMDTVYDHFWPSLETRVPRVKQNSKIYNLKMERYPKIIKTLEAKFQKQTSENLSFKRRENTELKDYEEDFDDDDEPGF